MSYYQQISEGTENFIIIIEGIKTSRENIKVDAREDSINVEINNEKKEILNFPLKNKNLKIDVKNISAKLSNEILTITAKLLKKERKEKSVEVLDVKENIIEEKEKEISRLNEKYNELNDRYLRLYADFENSRKFWDKKEEELRKYSGLDIIKNLLPIMDSFELALKDKNNEQNEGLRKIYENFKKTLFNYGLNEINSLNKKFDPLLHEALMIENTDKFEDGVIIEEFQKGYKFKDIVLRTAKVKVAKMQKNNKL